LLGRGEQEGSYRARKGKVMGFERDYETKGVVLIQTIFGAVNVSNYPMTFEELVYDEAFRELIQTSQAGEEPERICNSGPFCISPWDLDMPW